MYIIKMLHWLLKKYYINLHSKKVTENSDQVIIRVALRKKRENT